MACPAVKAGTAAPYQPAPCADSVAGTMQAAVYLNSDTPVMVPDNSGCLAACDTTHPFMNLTIIHRLKHTYLQRVAAPHQHKLPVKTCAGIPGQAPNRETQQARPRGLVHLTCTGTLAT
jgi:hypothetical protein